MSRCRHELQDVPGDTGGGDWSQESGHHSNKNQAGSQTPTGGDSACFR